MLTSAAVATIPPALLASASIIVATVTVLILVLIVHLVPLLRALLPVSRRRALRDVLALAVVNPKEVNVAAFNFHFCLGPILRLFHSY
jgi:hypothetical protein